MNESTPGLHHVSAIAGDPQENVDFYTEVLGLRLVKQTVNFDEKFMYHLYYGDQVGSPGSLITFFPYQRGTEGRIGKPQSSATAFTIPNHAVQYWYDRLNSRGVDVEEPVERFGETVLAFRDHDGQPLELVARKTDRPPATDSVPAEYAIRGLHSVTLLSSSVFHTAATLEVLGFSLQDQEGDRVRYRAPDASAGTIDLLDVEASYGREGIGTVHHVAFRAGGGHSPSGENGLPTRDWSRPGSKTDGTSNRYTFANRAGFCSRSQPLSRALPLMKTDLIWGRRCNFRRRTSPTGR